MSKVVSIITPSFNRADIIGETAASIFNQTYPYWEWVIVDDGSTDNSWSVLQELAAKDNRVKIFQRNREPKGACTCRNIAVEKSTGEYVIFLDTDDLLASFCLEQRTKAFSENRECDFIIFPMLLFKSKPDDVKMLWSTENGKDDLMRVIEGDPICQGTGTLWKKSSFIKVGMWKEDLKLWQDIELHIRSLLWPMKFVKRMDVEPDVFLRISDVSLSRTGFNSLPKLKSRISVFFDTTEALSAKSLLAQYKNSLRYMGWGIVINAINCGYFSEAENVLMHCKKYDLFSSHELKQIKNYFNLYKYKLYKIKPLNNYYTGKASAILPKQTSTIGNIQWNRPVAI